MLINLMYAVTAFKDGGWPHMNLISHVGPRARVTTALGDTEVHRGLQLTNAREIHTHTHTYYAYRKYTYLFVVVLITEKVSITPP